MLDFHIKKISLINKNIYLPGLTCIAVPGRACRPGSSISQTRQPPWGTDFEGPPILQNKQCLTKFFFVNS